MVYENELKFILQRFPLVLFIIAVHLKASSQDWEEAFFMSESYIERGDFNEAKNSLYRNKALFSGDSLQSVYFQQLGYISYLEGSFQQAKTNLIRAIDNCTQAQCDDELQFFNYFLIGKTYSALSSLTEAESNFTRALSIWEKFVDQRNDLLITLLIQLNNIYIKQSEFTKLEESLNILEELIGSSETHLEDQRSFCIQRTLCEFFQGDIAGAKSYLEIGINLFPYAKDEKQRQFFVLKSTLYFITGEKRESANALDRALSHSADQKITFPFSELIGLSSCYFFHYYDDDNAAIEKLNHVKNAKLKIVKQYAYKLLIELQIQYNLTAAARRTKQYLLNNQSVLGISATDIKRYEARILASEGRINEAIEKYRQFNKLNEEDIDSYATLLIERGASEEAKELYINKLDEIAGEKGEENIEYITLMNNLGILYLQLEEFREAEFILKSAMDISRKTFGESSAQFAYAANNLGTLYFDIGNYEASVNYFMIAKERYKVLFSAESEAYLTLQNNIAVLYSAIGSYDTSIDLLSANLEIERKLFGESNLNYLITLNNLVKERINNKEYDKALKEVKNVIRLLESLRIGQEELARAYFLKGLTYFETGNYAGAISTLIRSKDKYVQINKTKTKDYAITLFKLAESYAIIGKEQDARIFFEESISLFNSSVDRVFSFSSEKEKEKYLKTIQQYYDLYNYYVFSHFENEELIANKLFEQSLFRKGILFKSSVQLRNAIINNGDEELMDKYYQWQAVQKQISQGIGFNDESQMVELEGRSNQLEKELYQRARLNNMAKELIVSDLSSHLNENQAVIDFIRYYDPTVKDHFFGCLLFIANKQPVFKELCKERDILNELGEVAGNNKPYIDKLYGNGNTHNDRLFKLIWEPIHQELEAVQEVIISPTGILHKLSFDAIGRESEQLLGDRCNIRYMADLTKVANINNNIALQKIGLFGGVQYSTEKATTEYWPYLPGTKIEVDNIESILKSVYRVDKYLGLNASETNFKNQAPRYDVLHIATHGFFFPDQQTLATTMSDKTEVVEDVQFRSTRQKAGLTMFSENSNPLIRSGIALAKANDLSNPDRYYASEDGVLTAFEVSQMNLSQNKLVVLSACETGVGEIRGNEGVYGLERAFKMQGVPFLIISLWQVPDNETKEFMSLFYEYLVTENLTINAAFKRAQHQMRKKYPPYFWAAFKLVE